MKEIVIIGGPNGAGKTTAARVFLRDFLDLHEYLNADEIARRISPNNPDSAAFRAGREPLKTMRRLIAANLSFAIETTCSGKSYLPMIEHCKAQGWRITFYYLWLPRPEDSIARVARRVSQGGHDIPTEAIFRRFRAGLSNAIHLYLPLADRAEIYDNSDRHRVLVARRCNGPLVEIVDRKRWDLMLEVAR